MSDIEIIKTLFLLFAGHALGDFALQNEFVATNKDPHSRDFMSQEQRAHSLVIWPHLMTAHSLIHGALVYLITGKISLGIGEALLHWLTDYSKCQKWFNFHVDQMIHVLTKIFWVYLLATQNLI